MSAISMNGALRARRLIGAAAAAVACGGLLGAGTAAAQSFQRGDVFLTGAGSVQEYTPSGSLVQTVAGTAGAGALCFSPDGQDLVLPGIGLFNSAGLPLSSNWAAVAGGGRCVVDGYGDVYYALDATNPVLVEYSLTGMFKRTISLPTPLTGIEPFAIALGADQCTLYYGMFADAYGIGRYNVCTNTSLTAFNTDDFDDDLTVLPDGRVLALDDPGASLFSASGATGGVTYPSPFQPANDLRTMSLDPDGSSVWLSGNGVVEYDINTGHLLTEWGNLTPAEPLATPAGGPIAVYGPPLAGSADIGTKTATLAAGVAEAAPVTAAGSGSLSQLHVFLDGASAATSLTLGIYANGNGRPGQLLAAASVAQVTPGAWNVAPVSGVTLTAGQTYWVAALAPAGSGSATIRVGTQRVVVWSTGRSLTTLPATWGASLPWYASAPTAYGS